MWSCQDFLEEPSDVSGRTEAVVFSTIETAEQVLAAPYSSLPWGWPCLNGNGPWSQGILIYFAPISTASDEADTALEGGYNFVHPQYHEGLLTAGTINPYREDKWDYDWFAIRNAWYFYDKVDMVNDGTPQSYINQRKAEALGLVAQRYYEMFKRYGGLPWIDHYITMGESIDMSRMSITRTVDSICSLLDRAIAMPELPERNAVNEFGRVNKVALRMLKARVLLWSASPLFNPEDNQSYYPSFNKQELIKHETYDKNRWQEAADACLEAINAAHGAGYALYTKYGDPVKDYKAAVTEFPDIDANGTAKGNPEIIWGTRPADSYASETYQSGSRVTIWSTLKQLRGTVGTYLIPLQNMVDKYELRNGSDQPADYWQTTSDPYNNLDRRFNATIYHHGYKLGKTVGPFTLDMRMEPAGDQYPAGAQNFTGYYLAKFFDDDYIAGAGNYPQAFWPYMRLSDLYLMYAEALNEVDYASNSGEILHYVNLVRNRAGQPNLEDKPGFQATQAYVRECIRKERIVELCYEDQIYFDYKRWKVGDKYIGGNMYGMRITGDMENPTFSKFLYETRVWSSKWYLFPLYQTDVLTTNGVLAQNPGW